MTAINEIVTLENMNEIINNMNDILPFSSLSTDGRRNLSYMIYCEILERYASPIIENFKTESLSSDNILVISNLIKLKKSKQWEKLYNITIADYNPLYNVDASEITTYKPNVTEILTDTYNKNTEYSKGTNISTTQEQLTNAESDNFFFGDNSDNAMPSDRNTSSIGKIQNVAENTGSDNDKETGTIVHSTTKNGEDITEISRKGNIGVTMTQQLLDAERKFWESFDFYNLIIKDIVNFLTIPLYF